MYSMCSRLVGINIDHIYACMYLGCVLSDAGWDFEPTRRNAGTLEHVAHLVVSERYYSIYSYVCFIRSAYLCHENSNIERTLFKFLFQTQSSYSSSFFEHVTVFFFSFGIRARSFFLFLNL